MRISQHHPCKRDPCLRAIVKGRWSRVEWNNIAHQAATILRFHQATRTDHTILRHGRRRRTILQPNLHLHMDILLPPLTLDHLKPATIQFDLTACIHIPPVENH